jgi:hypothetical protein
MKNITLLLLLLAAVQFTNILDFVIMMPLGSQLMPAVGIGSQEFGLVISAYTLSAGATGLAGLLVVSLPGGALLHYEWVGYVTVAARALSLLVIRWVCPAPANRMLPPAGGSVASPANHLQAH